MTATLKRILVCTLIITVCAAILPLGHVSAQTKGKKYLVKKSFLYQYDEKSKKYKKLDSYTFKYDSSKNPVSIRDRRAVTKLEWTGTGRDISALREKYYDDVINMTYENGKRIGSIQYSNDNVEKPGYEKWTYTYNKRGYRASATLLSDDPSYSYKEITNYKYSYKYYKNGLPKRITAKSKFKIVKYKKEPNKIKNYKRVTTQTQYFNDKGLVTKVIDDTFDDGRKMNGQRSVFTYKYNKKGLVSQILMKNGTPAKGKMKFYNTYKITFKYTNIPIDKGRYAAQINDISRMALSPSFFETYIFWY